LRGDDGPYDIDVICDAKPLDGGVQDLAWIRQGCVVHDDTRSARAGEDPLERRSVAVKVLDVSAHGLDLKAETPQLGGKLLERCAAGDERAPEALAAEAPHDAKRRRRARPRSAGGDGGQRPQA